MILCKDCKYWSEKGSSKEMFGKCSNEKFVYVVYEGCEDHDLIGDELEYWDYECYGARFHTGKNFGCIHGEC